MDEVLEIVFCENDMFCLDDKIDEIFLNDERFRQDGVLKFSIAEECASAGSVSAQKLIDKYSSSLKGHLKRLNPIRLVGSKDVFGHVAVDSQYLDEEDVDGCLAVLGDVNSYEVQPELNCCLQALQDSVDTLLEHIYATVWCNSKMPPSHFKQCTLKTIKKEAGRMGKEFDELKKVLQESDNVAEKAALLRRDLQLSEEKDQSKGVVCACPMCITGDDVLDGGREDTDPVATSLYYASKGFMYASGINVERSAPNMLTRHFSMSFLASTTCTRMLQNFYPGISTSYMFFGTSHSFAAIHLEDMSLWSINFLHHGYPKLWVVVSPTMVSKLRYFLSRVNASGAEVNCMNLLSHKYFLLTVAWLKKMGIKFKVVVQRAGQGVIVSPNAAHFVFNLGPNMAEAINFLSKAWLPYGIVYQGCACMTSQIHLNLQPLVVKLRPDFLPSTCGNRIPVPHNLDYFCRTILHPGKWKEAFGKESDKVEEILPPDEEDVMEDVRNAEPPQPEPVPQHSTTRQPRRRPIQCPLCNISYKGGHKFRLDDHISSHHKKMNASEKKLVKKYYEQRFPKRGDKVPKKLCNICRELRGGSLKRHQASSACKPKL